MAEDRKKVVNFWLKSANEDWDLALELVKLKRHYRNALFFGQLTLEKILKALYYQSLEGHPLPIHNLSLLAKNVGLELDDTAREELREISSFNISARYDNIKQAFYRKATPEFVKIWMEKIADYRKTYLSLFNKV